MGGAVSVSVPDIAVAAAARGGYAALMEANDA
jgi:hypothetical protein